MTQPGTLNPYPYVLNNPLRYVDPLGLRIDQDLGTWEVNRQLGRVQTPNSNSTAVGTTWNEYESDQGHSGISNIMQQFWQWRENNFREQYLSSLKQAHEMLMYQGVTPDDPNYLQELRKHVELFESANNFIGPSGGLKIIGRVNKGYKVLAGAGKAGSKGLSKIDDFIDLTAHRRDHILNRHRAGASKAGKTEFPSNWSDDRIIHQVSDIATDPNAIRGVGKWDSPYAIGVRDGVTIRVDFYPPNNLKYAGQISTAYPIIP
ncbi:MAG: hypothetical protein VR67_03520 [Peptococcaceae bacterium BRH_c8a]|nr:MAG: hypothetical protein VR67_03520 [Peptococcaceae bacterium BRH_c8a]